MDEQSESQALIDYEQRQSEQKRLWDEERESARKLRAEERLKDKERESDRKQNDKYYAIWTGISVWFALVSSIGIPCWQVYNFLKTGQWAPVSGLDILVFCGLADDWIHYPQDWLGAHKILEWLHAVIVIWCTTIIFILTLKFIKWSD